MLGWQLGTALPELPEDQEKGSQKSGVRRREKEEGPRPGVSGYQGL